MEGGRDGEKQGGREGGREGCERSYGMMYLLHQEGTTPLMMTVEPCPGAMGRYPLYGTGWKQKDIVILTKHLTVIHQIK